jgi:hypothetical protein
MTDYPPLMTADEIITYLRLDVDQRDPRERLRNASGCRASNAVGCLLSSEEVP